VVAVDVAKPPCLGMGQSCFRHLWLRKLLLGDKLKIFLSAFSPA
jgi:hypothetical protein